MGKWLANRNVLRFVFILNGWVFVVDVTLGFLSERDMRKGGRGEGGVTL